MEVATGQRVGYEGHDPNDPDRVWTVTSKHRDGTVTLNGRHRVPASKLRETQFEDEALWHRAIAEKRAAERRNGTHPLCGKGAS